MEFEDLIGKTISSATTKQLISCDDTGFLHLTFDDGTVCLVTSSYGDWTGSSVGEYPTYIGITDDMSIYGLGEIII